MPRVLALGLLVLGISLILVAGSWMTAPAAPNPTVHATLSSFEETPTLSTSGTGEFSAKISGSAIEYELSYANLEGGAVLFAHIHLGARGTAGGVVAFLCGGGGKPSCPDSGTVSGTIGPDDILAPIVMSTAQGIAAGEFDEFVRAILSGTTYANVHTTGRPAGEIRGQISGVGN